MTDGQPVPPGKWQVRLLRATLPIGILLLLAWIAFLVASQIGLRSVPGVLGLITSLVLIVAGYGYRRDMAAR